MAYDNVDKIAHIREFQHYLYVLSNVYDEIPTVIPDGYFGAQTKAGVEAFQRMLRLPVTGIVDRVTWDSIFAEYARIESENEHAVSVRPILPEDFPLKSDSNSEATFILQLMLASLSNDFPSLPKPDISGKFDEKTQAAVTAMQIILGLPPSGEIDKTTWDLIASTYNSRKTIA